MTKKLLLSALILMAFSTLNVSSQVRKAARNQKQRIHQGVQSGEITPGERARIAAKERDVRQEVREAKADGVITIDEKRDIRHEQKQASRTIYRTKHNAKDRK